MPTTTAALALIIGLGSITPGALANSPTNHALIAKSLHTTVAFQKAEAPVTGSVTVHEKDGKTTLHFSKDFSTNPQAPDLQVVLLKSATPLKTLQAPHYPLKPGSYTQIAPLRSAKGEQSYTLPAGVDPKAFGSVLIWCRTANATMAWAPLHGN